MAVKKYLVVEHLERIGWKTLDTHPQAIEEFIRGRSGVYALYKDERLYYVGLAKNLMARLKDHDRDRHKGKWDRFSVYLMARDEHMKELESLLLRIVNPVGNIQGGRFAGSTNLRHELRRKMTALDRERRDDLIGRKRKRSKRVTGAGDVRRTKKKSGAAPGGTPSPYLAGRFTSKKRLRGAVKDKAYIAVLLQSGRIKYADQTFFSPSGAGAAAIGHPINGWTFWNYRDAKGEWHTLDTLRKGERLK